MIGKNQNNANKSILYSLFFTAFAVLLLVHLVMANYSLLHNFNMSESDAHHFSCGHINIAARPNPANKGLSSFCLMVVDIIITLRLSSGC